MAPSPEFEFSSPFQLEHHLGEVRTLDQTPSVDPANRGREAAVAPEALVGELDHPGVRPGLRPDLHHSVDRGNLKVIGKGMRQDHLLQFKSWRNLLVQPTAASARIADLQQEPGSGGLRPKRAFVTSDLGSQIGIM